MRYKFSLNKDALIYAFIGFIFGSALMLLLWPNRIAKLESGEEVIAISKKGYVTTEELFDELKKDNSLDALLNIIDLKLVKEHYPKLDKEANKKALEQADSLLKMYSESYGMSESEFLSQNGFKNKDAFVELLKDQYYYEKYYKDYLASKVSEKEIKDFYNKKVFGNKNVIIYSSLTDKSLMNNVKKMLDNKKSKKDISKKYSQVVVNEITDFDFSMSSNYSDSFTKALKKLNKGEYSSVIEDDTYGYLIIYIKDSEEMPELKDVKDKIIETLSADINADDPNLYYNAFIELRENNDFKINDTSLAQEYKNYVNQYK